VGHTIQDPWPISGEADDKRVSLATPAEDGDRSFPKSFRLGAWNAHQPRGDEDRDVCPTCGVTIGDVAHENTTDEYSIQSRLAQELGMENALTLLGVLALWWVLQVWVLPRFGVPT
jgi:hypothetical protein